MGRQRTQRIQDASHAVLVEGERVTSEGRCWGAQFRSRVPLLFLGRQQYVLALTDRRMLVFAPRRRSPTAPDLVLGKRYETFTVERVKRRRPLLQVVVRATNGNRLVFEFRRGQRELGGELIARLTPRAQSSLRERLGEPPLPDTKPETPVTVAPVPRPVSAVDAKVEPDDDHTPWYKYKRRTKPEPAPTAKPEIKVEPDDDHTPWYKYKRRSKPEPAPNAVPEIVTADDANHKDSEDHSRFWGSE